jgi:hypothetical protein
MLFDLERVRRNVQQAATEDLLDRITVYRAGMEPEALELIETELDRRGISAEEIAAHEEQRWLAASFLPDGTAAPCSFCHRPAVAEGWSWHTLWGLVPVFPRFYRYCAEHQPDEPIGRDSENHA